MYLADAMYLADPVHGFTSRMMLEIVQRQPQQLVENVEAQFCIQPRSYHGNDQSAGKVSLVDQSAK
jgi:hypothetical protein